MAQQIQIPFKAIINTMDATTAVAATLFQRGGTKVLTVGSKDQLAVETAIMAVGAAMQAQLSFGTAADATTILLAAMAANSSIFMTWPMGAMLGPAGEGIEVVANVADSTAIVATGILYRPS